MDCSPTSSSVHGNSPGKKPGVGYHALLWDIPDPGIESTSLMFPALAGKVFLFVCLFYHFLLSGKPGGKSGEG